MTTIPHVQATASGLRPCRTILIRSRSGRLELLSASCITAAARAPGCKSRSRGTTAGP